MKSHAVSPLRRLTAGLVTLALLLWQLALPVYAFALTQDEIAAMPTVTVNFQTAEGGPVNQLAATPTTDATGKAYWITLPAEAFSYPVTLSIVPSAAAPTYTFTPDASTPVQLPPSPSDYTGESVLLTAYQDGVVMEEYHLYLSTATMPAEVPPATVPVTYVDAADPNIVLYSEMFTAYYNTDNVVMADSSHVPEGYTLQGDNGAYVTVDETGTPSPASVTFYFAKAAVKGTVTVYYTDLGGNELASPQTLTLDPGTYPISPDLNLVPAGYTLSDTTPAPVEVTIGSDGVASREAITFEFAETVVETTPPVTDTPTTEAPQTENPTTDTPTTDTPTTDTPTTDTPPETTTPVETTAPVLTPVNLYAQVSSTSANFRTETSTSSAKAFADVSNGAYLWVYGTLVVPDDKGTDVTWAKIAYNGTDCYVWYSLISVLSQEDSDAYNYAQPSPVPGTETQAPVETTASPSPSPSPSPLPAQVTGYFYTLAEAPMVAGAGSDTILATLPANTGVYVEGQNYLDSLAWHKVTYQGTAGYIREDYLRMMTSDEVTAFLTTPSPSPSPSLSPSPSPSDSPSPSPSPSVSPSVSPSESPSASPSPSVSPSPSPLPQYVGYAVTTAQTALRDNASLDDSSIIVTLPVNTLLVLNGQTTLNGVVWTGAQTRLGTNYIGILQDASVQRITDAQAQALIDAYNAAHATPTPTVTPTPTPVPAQLSGYYITLGTVPLRTVNSNYADVTLWLAANTVVNVSGQVYNEGYGWHVSTYGQYVGYIRADQMRKLSDAEVEAYKKTLATPTPTPAATAQPYNPYADSSYGYVSSSTVNFRAEPSSSAAKLKTLKQYAFALILGSKTVNGTLWYNINQAGTTGWVDGRYFQVLNLSELSTFLNSSNYLTGLTNNSTSGSSSSSSSGSTSSTSGGSSASASQGQVSSVEDWNVGVWKNPSAGLSASYEPFNPYATPTAPLVSASPTPSPTPTFVVGTMIPIPYEEASTETQTGGSGWVGLAIGGVVLLGGAGGVYAYALNQNKKRRLAARAASTRRNVPPAGVAGATGAAAAGSTSPYARRAVAAPPAAGSTQRQDPNGTDTTSRANPYARPAQPANPYARPANPAEGGAENPYVRPAQPANPYTQPIAGETQPANPYARPTGAPRTPGAAPQAAPTEPTRPANPYAQPRTPVDPYAQRSPSNPYASTPQGETTEPVNPTPRRTTRMSRHQNPDDSGEA
ncbi:MAG: hypothetical protein VB104_05410 [Candidatus Limiplasma sp.]|nr:hypothetical protein [Candidatus Limiplasma sp.]